MTRTTQVEWHDERPFVHFGSPEDVTYWKKKPKDKPVKTKKRKKDKR